MSGTELERAKEQPPVPRVTKGVLTRDFLIFELKLLLDGFIDLVMAPVAAVAFVAELLLPSKVPGRRFYRVLRMGERWDRWLSLYQPAKDAETSGEGLLRAGSVSADSLIGRIEDLVREGRLSRSARDTLQRVAEQEERRNVDRETDA